MPAVLPSKLMQISESHDAKEALITALGSALDKIKVFGPQVLVATYIAPTKTKGGILRPQGNITEDLYMGILGLVVKKGPLAFQDDKDLKIEWKGQDVKIHEWCIFRFSSAWEFHLNGVSVRLIEDRDIRAVVDDPEVIASKPHITIA